MSRGRGLEERVLEKRHSLSDILVGTEHGNGVSGAWDKPLTWAQLAARGLLIFLSNVELGIGACIPRLWLLSHCHRVTPNLPPSRAQSRKLSEFSER